MWAILIHVGSQYAETPAKMREHHALAHHAQTAYFSAMKCLPLLLCLSLTGCLLTVNSRNPFYTDATRVALPAAIGGWAWEECGLQTNRATDHRETEIGWIAPGADPLQLCVSSGSSNFCTWVFFRVSGNLYCDWLMTDKADAYHQLNRAAWNGHRLQFTQLDGDWLTNAITRGQVDLAAPTRAADSNLVFQATAQQWVSFLERYGTNDAAFSKEKSCLSRRYNFVPARRQP